jgi:4-amino-4-deoxy-L-arabinose transferase-like glycosyltransferase
MKRIFNTKFLIVVILLLASFLRLYKISVNPPSLFGDELDLGYQAYSILKTGKDYQGNFMPIHFHSLAEYRTPLYLYSAVPTVALFGISPLGVRLPAVIFGVLCVLAMFLLTKELLNYASSSPISEHVALLTAFLMSINPWLLQYSRAGFEVTEMLFLLIFGTWLFLISLKNGRWLWLSVVCLVLTPWVYATAKLFTPVYIVVLFLAFKDKIFQISKSNLIKAAVAALVVGLPIIYSTTFSGGTQRISDISVFTDPNMVNTVNEARGLDKKIGVNQLESKLINNKFVYWGTDIIENYFQTFSTGFLFIKGDTNMRQSVGTGGFYLIEIIPLLLGFAFFLFDKERSSKIKILVMFWLLFGAFPSAMTLNGGNHATRLILIAPPLIFLISYGWYKIYHFLSNKSKYIFLPVIFLIYVVSVLLYFYQYYSVYPVQSEKWWHYGWGPAINEIKAVGSNYDRVMISMSGEPAWIFFAGHYQYDPALWQKEFPINNKKMISGFGNVSYIGKYYFGSPSPDIQIYGLGKYIDSKTLYLANAKEIGNNLLEHPEGVPPGLKLIKTIKSLTGEPVFYIFSGTSN